MVSASVALWAAVTLGAPTAASVAQLSHAALRPHADLALRLGAPAGADPREAFPERRGVDGPPPCLGDVCQPRVAVPGFEPGWSRPHRSELFVLALTRARVEPLASIAWALASTGLRLDWTPAALEGPNAAARGWGSVFVRLRLRLDADNRPVFAPRPR